MASIIPEVSAAAQYLPSIGGGHGAAGRVDLSSRAMQQWRGQLLLCWGGWGETNKQFTFTNSGGSHLSLLADGELIARACTRYGSVTMLRDLHPLICTGRSRHKIIAYHHNVCPLEYHLPQGTRQRARWYGKRLRLLKLNLEAILACILFIQIRMHTRSIVY